MTHGLSRTLLCAALILAAVPGVLAQDATVPFSKIKHFVVIYGENISFDGIFGAFPGAEGLAASKSAAPQTDHDGQVLPALPPVRMKDKHSNGADVYLDTQLPNAPFNIEDHLEKGKATGDLVHRFYQEQEQINGGKNDRFAAVSDAGGLAMGYYHDDNLNLWRLAKDFTLLDHFHHSAFGGSFLNHFWLVCTCTPEYQEALTQPPEIACGTDNGQPKLIPKRVVCLDPGTGFLARKPQSPQSAMVGAPQWVNNAQVTPDGFAVNTLQPSYPPFADEPKLPPQKMPSIGDRLSDARVSWAWYAGGWNDALSGRSEAYKAPDYFQPHHQPLNYFASFAPGTGNRAHLQDESDFLAAIRDGNLPAVSFWKPVGRDTMHPGYTDIRTGDARLGEVVDLIRKSPQWQDTAIIITFDENGGTWDHVAPPKRDRWGPGVRVPALVISPYAKRGFVDHSVYDTTAILKTLEVRFGLPAMTEADAASPDLSAAFDFSQPVEGH
jgi:acid phosphatase